MHAVNFTVVTIGHKVGTRVVAIDIWRADFDTGRLLESRRMVLGHCVRRKTLQTYGDVLNIRKTLEQCYDTAYHESQQVF